MNDLKLELASPAPPPPVRDLRPLRWWFVRVPRTGSPEDMTRARLWVSQAGRVLDEGLGTAAVPDAGWFVVRTRCQSVAEVRERMGAFHRGADLIEEVPNKSHARALTRQMTLIG